VIVSKKLSKKPVKTPKKLKKSGRKRDKGTPAGFVAQGDGLDGLRDENDFLRAMLGKCLRCGSRTDDMALAQIHLEVAETRFDERTPGGGSRFHGHVHLGGGFGAGGDTREECLANLRKNFTSDLLREFERALKHPTAGIAKNGYPDRAITPDFEAVQLLKTLHADIRDVETALAQLQKHELWGGYARIAHLRETNEKLRETIRAADPHEAGVSEEALAMLHEGIASAQTSDTVKIDEE
jgi:hypothetical protein